MTFIARRSTGVPLARVEAEPITIGPYTFCVARMLDPNTGKQNPKGRIWRVYCPVIGAHVAPPANSKTAAILAAQNRIANLPPDATDRAREQWLAHMAKLSPRVKLPTYTPVHPAPEQANA